MRTFYTTESTLTIVFFFSEESVSVDSIKNALKLFQKWDILECHSEEKLRLYYLKDNEDNSDSVKNLYTQINKFRMNPL